MLRKPHRATSKPMKIRKSADKCHRCGKKTEDLHIRVDEANFSITNNSPWYCRDCYKIVYGKDY